MSLQGTKAPPCISGWKEAIIYLTGKTQEQKEAHGDRPIEAEESLSEFSSLPKLKGGKRIGPRTTTMYDHGEKRRAKEVFRLPSRIS